MAPQKQEKDTDTLEARSIDASKGEKLAERGNAEVAQRVEAENEVGYRGQAADATPNENYTVAGVIAGAPTPETVLEDGQRVDQAVVNAQGQVEAIDAGATAKASAKGKGSR